MSHRAWLRSAAPALAANAALLGLWLGLFRAVYPYFAEIFTREEFRTNQLVLVGAIGLVALQARKGSFALRLDLPPRARPLPLAALLAPALIYLVVERYLDINTLSAALFGLSGYGLVGLWMPARAWRQGLPAALLLVGALPFGEHMQTFIGYPVRLATAAIVRDGLAAVGVRSLGVDTILVFENGIARVDLPCSGVKSLWTGGLFFLAAGWIERRPLNLRWLLAAFGLAVALLAANLLRVAVLVTVGEVAGWRLAAEMLHVPLGVLGFAAACGLGLLMLRASGSLDDHAPEASTLDAPAALRNRSEWKPVLLAAASLALMALLYAPRTAAADPPAAEFSFPQEIQVQGWPFSQGEIDWLAQSGVMSAQRFTFRRGDLSGSLLLVAADSWRAHHRPESCFEVYGLEAERSESVLAAERFPVRVLKLSTPEQPGLASAAYWLQSGARVTDDYAERIWDDLSPQRSRWVLVTVLFDGQVDPKSEEAVGLYRALAEMVKQQ